MGKKVMVSEASSRKVSKNHEKKTQPHHQHHQLHSLIKVLKPKVYITDASSFKRLVQKLTGNAASNPSVPSSPNLILNSCPETASEGSVQILAPMALPVECQDHNHGDSRSTRVEVQVPVIESSQITGNVDHPASMVGLEDLDSQITGNVDHPASMVGLEELEAWLLEDVNHLAVPFCESSYYYDHPQEVSIYDYGFSGMW
ncbi:hypothetical protein ACJRO7_007008 [Eucalyptus globulus]|uniref:VQ domain-containing protein n=1 Tax=Eucalyptus globulus TaxID=34317 RepID=A0ABD3INB0_EUCGL